MLGEALQTELAPGCPGWATGPELEDAEQRLVAAWLDSLRGLSVDAMIGVLECRVGDRGYVLEMFGKAMDLAARRRIAGHGR